MKKEIRVLGIDDAPFEKHKKGKTLVIGTIYRGGQSLDGLLSCYVDVDGNDSTDNIIDMINKSKFKKQLKVVMIDGIAVGGFNVIDINKLYKKTGIPVIVVIRRKPDIKKIMNVLKRLKFNDKIKLIRKAGRVKKINKVYIQNIGIPIEKVKDIIDVTTIRGYIPEPIRAAHLIAGGVTFGESRGRA